MMSAKTSQAPLFLRGGEPPNPVATASRRAFVLGGAALLAACGGGDGGTSLPPATAPLLDVSSNVPDVAEGRVTIRFEFSAEPAAFASGSLPFSLEGGRVVAGSFTKVSATVFTVQIDPNANSVGTIKLVVPAGAFADKTGSAFSNTAYSFAQRYDTRVPDTEPSVNITANAPAGGAAGPFTLTFTFNLDVGSSFTDSDVLVTNAAAGTLTRVSSTVYTMVVTPPAGTVGIALIEVPAGAFTAVSTGVSNGRSWGIAVTYRT